MPSSFNNTQVKFFVSGFLVLFTIYLINQRKSNKYYKGKKKEFKKYHKHKYKNYVHTHHSHGDTSTHVHTTPLSQNINYPNIASYYFRGKEQFEEEFINLNIEEMSDDDILRWAKTLNEQDVELS
tara:strand:- start:512 stop:886 length:375 start_codon:yes stop_codon:yes gene_type:complete